MPLLTGVRGRDPTASLGIVPLSGLDFGPLLAAFWGVLSLFVTLSLPKCARRAAPGKSFCVSDAVEVLTRTPMNGLLGTRLGVFPRHSFEHPLRLEPGLVELEHRRKNGDSHRLTVDVPQDDEPDLVVLAQFVGAVSSVAR